MVSILAYEGHVLEGLRLSQYQKAQGKIMPTKFHSITKENLQIIQHIQMFMEVY
jgi:hypothetical protein